MATWNPECISRGHWRAHSRVQHRGVHRWFPRREFPKRRAGRGQKREGINLRRKTTSFTHRQQFFCGRRTGHGSRGDAWFALEVDVHVRSRAYEPAPERHSPRQGLQLEVDEIVFNGLASSLALLSNEQKELGALVMDIGAARPITSFTPMASSAHGRSGDWWRPRFQRPAYGLKCLEPRRKTQARTWFGAGGRGDQGQTVTITNELGLPLKTVNVEHLRRIMSLRLEEISSWSRRFGAGRAVRLSARRVFLCGGCARVPQIAPLAERVLQMPVSLARPIPSVA